MGCEKEEKYIEIVKQRVDQFFDGNLRLRSLGKPVYQPSGNEKVAQVPEEWSDTDSIYG
jgi:adenine-specific DNA-methyltransferase